jgi:hypothetical protein
MRSRILAPCLACLACFVVGCDSTLSLGTNDAGATEAGRDAAEADGHSSSPAEALPYTWCSYTSDAGAPGCSGLAPWDASSAESAQLQLECLDAHGTIVSNCPIAGLVGCCSVPICPPPPPGENAECALSGTGAFEEQPGENVTCYYDEDAGTAHVAQLECEASGGVWSTTPE